MSNERKAVILSAARTPIGKFQGGLSAIPAVKLGAAAVQAAVERAGVDPKEIEEVLMGQVVQAGSGQASARQAAIFAGLPASVGASTINKVCGSGLKAVMFAAQAICARDADLIVAGGMESMSRAPYLVNGRLGEMKFGHRQLVDSLLHDGLWDPFENWGMGMAAEFIADEYKISREAMDDFALRSHQKATAAQEAGKFKAEIAPIQITGRKGEVTILETDEGPRKEISLESLAQLKPAFKTDGKVTPGNSSSMNDGAAAVLVASCAYAEKNNLPPIAYVIDYAQFSTESKYLFAAPIQSISKLLKKIGWTFADVDLIEINEAFAAQVLADGYAFADQGWDWGKVNVNGGAIALGHPLGASGTRVLTTLIYALKDRGLKRGITSLCLGGGEAVAMAIETELSI